VVNNTPDPLLAPIEEHCRSSASASSSSTRKRAGYKAGALRLALAQPRADAEIIGVIDADYVVQPDWLKDLCPPSPTQGRHGAGAAGPSRRRPQRACITP
jgi:glucan 1,3-beta-glucosidase